MLPNPSCTPLAARRFAHETLYSSKRDVGFPYALPDGAGFTRVFSMPCFVAKPPHHRDILRSSEHHNRYQERFQRVLAAICP